MSVIIDETITKLEQAINERRDELERLSAARNALTAVSSSGNGSGSPAQDALERLAGARARKIEAAAKPVKRGTRLAQALALIESKPGITSPELGQAVSGSPSYGYQLVKRLKDASQIKPCGEKGWQVK